MKGTALPGSFDDLDIRIGRVLAVAEARTRKPTYRLTVDFGPEVGVKVSCGAYRNYSVDALVGRQVVAIVNLGPKQMGPEPRNRKSRSASTSTEPGIRRRSAFTSAGPVRQRGRAQPTTAAQTARPAEAFRTSPHQPVGLGRVALEDRPPVSQPNRNHSAR